MGAEIEREREGEGKGEGEMVAESRGMECKRCIHKSVYVPRKPRIQGSLRASRDLRRLEGGAQGTPRDSRSRSLAGTLTMSRIMCGRGTSGSIEAS